MSENFINENIYLFLILSLLTFVLLVIYKKISLHFKLLDSPSKNNIHKFPTPTGAGIVFSLIALISLLASQLHDAPLTYSSLIAEIIFAIMAFTSAFIYKFK